MSDIKELMIHILIASLPALIFPPIYEKRAALFPKYSDGEKQDHIVPLLTICCGFSLLLCWIFNSSLYSVLHLDFGMVPLFIGILSGRIVTGALLIVIQLLGYIVFDDNPTVPGIILNTGLLIYPLILLTSLRFKCMAKLARYGILSLYLLIGGSISSVWSLIIDKVSIFQENYLLVDSLLFTVLMMVVGCLVLFAIESAKEKEQLKFTVRKLTYNYHHEADKLQILMDGAPVSIILLDSSGSIMSLNNAFLKLYRLYDPASTKESILGHKLEQFSESFQTNFNHICSRYRERAFEEAVSELVQLDDKIFYVSFAPFRSNEDTGSSGTMVTIQDATELETLRSELSKVDRLSLVGQMAAGITHEIRNPMAVVRGFLQLMQEKSPSTLDHYYRIVMEELDRANGIINDFLSLAQNRPVHNKETISLHTIIDELTPLLWADANLRGQSIEVKLDETVPMFDVNPKEIKQLILNLCRNGMEAMEDKGQLIMETRVVPSGVELLVKDSGPGIPSDKLEKLFQPFYTTKSKGTGLGLALCQSIVERHFGKISVQSEEGKGTTFIVWFPIAYPQELAGELA